MINKSLNHDLGLTLTFYGKVKDGKMLENKISWKVLKILAKKVVYSVVFMSIRKCEYKRSRSFFKFRRIEILST